MMLAYGLTRDRLTLLLLLVIIDAQASAAAQATDELGPPICRACEIQLRPIVTLGRLSDSVSLTPLSRAVRDGHGRYYVGPLYTHGQWAVYGPDGAFEGAMGRAGPGPREFRRIDMLRAGAGDTLHVFHGTSHTILSPAFDFVRTGRLLANPTEVILLPDGYLLTGRSATRAGIGFAAHQLDARDSIVRSFGPEVSVGPSWARIFLMTDGGGGLVWLAPADVYRLELWSPDGARHRVIERHPTWFVPSAIEWDGMGTRLMALQRDRQGRVWLAFLVNDSGRGVGRHGQMPSVGDWNRMFCTVIEVIDPEHLQVIASTRFDAVIPGFVAERTVLSLREHESGLVVMDVFELHLAGLDESH